MNTDIKMAILAGLTLISFNTAWGLTLKEQREICIIETKIRAEIDISVIAGQSKQFIYNSKLFTTMKKFPDIYDQNVEYLDKSIKQFKYKGYSDKEAINIATNNSLEYMMSCIKESK